MYRYTVKLHCADSSLSCSPSCNPMWLKPSHFLSYRGFVSTFLISFYLLPVWLFASVPPVLCLRFSRRWVFEVTQCVSWLAAVRDRRPVREVVSGGRTLGEAVGYPCCGRSTLRVAGRQGAEVVSVSVVSWQQILGRLLIPVTFPVLTKWNNPATLIFR